MSNYRLVPGHNVNSPVNRAIRKYNSNNKQKTEKYNAVRGTNFNPLTKRFGPVNYESFEKKDDKKLSTGAIVAIIVGILVVLGAIFFVIYKKHKKQPLTGGDPSEFDSCPVCKSAPCTCNLKNDISDFDDIYGGKTIKDEDFIAGGDPINESNEEVGIENFKAQNVKKMNNYLI